MMLHKKSSSSRLLKLLALLPIVATALALNAETVTDVIYDEPQKKIIKKGKKNATIKTANGPEVVVVEQEKTEKTTDNKAFSDNPKNEYYMGLQKDDSDEKTSAESPFDVVEQMPEFPGGPVALFDYLSKNVRYPEEAQKKNIEGRVIATFVVEKDGSIADASIVRSIDPQLDAEALRVVSAMPHWIAGKQNGKAVRVKYTVPITFKLTEGSTAQKENYILEIDGKVVDNSEIGNIPPGKVASMEVQKAENGHPKRIIITTKK